MKVLSKRNRFPFVLYCQHLLILFMLVSGFHMWIERCFSFPLSNRVWRSNTSGPTVGQEWPEQDKWGLRRRSLANGRLSGLPRWLLGRVEASRIHRAALLTPFWYLHSSQQSQWWLEMGEQLYPVRCTSEGSPRLLQNLGFSHGKVLGAIRNPKPALLTFFTWGEEEACDVVEVSEAGWNSSRYCTVYPRGPMLSKGDRCSPILVKKIKKAQGHLLTSSLFLNLH